MYMIGRLLAVVLLGLTSLPLYNALQCDNPIGLADPNLVSLDQITVSSEAPGQSKEQIRYGCCQDKVGAAWCPAGTDQNPFVQIDLTEEVAFQQLRIQPPTFGRTIGPPTQFVKSYDLLVQLKGLTEFVTVAKNLPAIKVEENNITLTAVLVQTPIMTKRIRLELRDSQGLACMKLELYKCDVTTLCPQGFCQNGGVCSGQNSCDCSNSPGYFGNQCQYTVSQVVVNVITFIRITQTTIVTSTGEFTYTGSVTINTIDNLDALIIPPQSTVTVNSPAIDSCMKNLDACLGGFTITIKFSFDLIGGGYQMVISSGAESNKRGIALSFQNNQINCVVRTSTLTWTIVKTFTVTANVWYSMTISWSPGQGLFLLLGDVVIDSSLMPVQHQPVTEGGDLIVGYPQVTTTTTIRVTSIQTVELFWREAERVREAQTTASTTLATTTPAPTTTTPAPTTKDPRIPDKQIVVTTIDFVEITNDKITTSDPNTILTATGTVNLTKVQGNTVINIINGGQVTFPQIPCLADLNSCLNGFTVTVEIKVVTSKEENIVLVTTGAEKPGNQGLTLIYNSVNHTLTFTVTTGQLTWTVTREFNWLFNAWLNLTITWSPSGGAQLITNGVTIGSVVVGTTVIAGNPGNDLCIGCSLLPSGNLNTTIVISQVITSNVFVEDLIQANLTDIQTPDEKCLDSIKDFNFEQVSETKQEVVTSLGTVVSHGDVSTVKEGDDVILVLDQQGEYIEVSNTGFPCVDDITTCKTDLTYRITFRFTDFHVEPNFILSSGGDLLNSTGISLYYFHGKLNFWVKDGVNVWRAIYDQILDLNQWYTIDASWGHGGGIQLRLDGKLLKSIIGGVHPADPVTMKYPLHIAKSAADNKNKTSLMEILVFRLWTETVVSLENYHCDKDLEIHNPVDKCQENMTDIKFQEIEQGNALITSLGTLTTHGNVTVEQTFYKQGEMVLVIDEDGEYVDMGKTGIPCLDDVTTCNTNFNFRLTFMFTEFGITPNYIISSGGELLNSTGVSLYYYDSRLFFWVKQGTRIDKKFFSTDFEVLTWYTLDASWVADTGKIKVYINGNEIFGIQMPSTPTPHAQDKHTLLIGKSPGKEESTRMNILLFRFWEKTREELVNEGCDKILEVDNPPPVTTLAPPTTTQEPFEEIKFTFVTITNTVLVTTVTNMTVYGQPTLEPVPAGNILILEKPGDYVDIGMTGVLCLDDITLCNTGFNFRIIFTLTSFTVNPQIIISNGADIGISSGITVKYQNKIIYIYVKRSTETLLGQFPFELTPGYWFTIDVTWSRQTGLEVLVNNNILNGTITTIPHFNVAVTQTLLLGKSPDKNETTIMRVFELDFWSREHGRLNPIQTELPQLPIVPVTEALSSTTTVPSPTTTSTTTHSPITHIVWTLTQVTTTTIVSGEWSLTLVGGPTSGVDGVLLEKPDQSLTIPNVGDTCLTNPAKCLEGLTIEINIKLTVLKEDTIIFTSGAEKPNEPGITLLYRYGHVHVIVSTSEQSWFVSFPQNLIKLQTFTSIIISWSKVTSIQVFIDRVFVAVSEPPLINFITTPTFTNSVTIGGGNTVAVIQEVNIWLVHIEILIQINVIQVQGQGTTKPPVTTSTASPTTTPSISSSYPITASSTPGAQTTGFCPIGCVPLDQCTVPSGSTTTGCPTQPPTTPQPATTQQASTAAPSTAAPSTAAPTTAAPTTAAPSTAAPTTAAPSTAAPSTAAPSTAAPSTAASSTAASSTAAPTTAAPTTAAPTTAAPTTAAPSTAAPTTAAPTTAAPTTAAPTTPVPTTTTTTTAAPTLPPCPAIPGTVKLSVFADVNGQAQLMCSLDRIPDPNVQVRFTYTVRGVTSTWSEVLVEAPKLAGTLAVTEIKTMVLNKEITCTAEVRWKEDGYDWCGRTVSNVLVPSISITTTTEVIVIEGKDNQTIEIVPTCPPSAFCKPEDRGRCTVEITTIVTTERREIRCSRTEVVPQAVIGVGTVSGAGRESCGVTIDKDNWREGISIPVKATIDRVIDREQTRTIILEVRIRGEITREVTTIELNRVTVVIKDQDRRAQCASVNDPHLKTFDGTRYNNFVPGKFIMYKHNTLPYEVHADYRQCRPGRTPTCNCGAAIKSGDDVITFNSCDNNRRQGSQSVIDVQLYKNGELTPGTIITRIGCGQKYEVYLPTGMKVTVVRSRAPFMNIFISPSVTDVEQSGGLCGKYNGIRSDDFDFFNLREVNRFILLWRIEIDIFRGVPPETGLSPPVYCTCQSGQVPFCGTNLDFYLCRTKPIPGVVITSILIRQSITVSISSTVQVNSRGKRAAESEVALLDAEGDGDELAMSMEAAEAYCTEYVQNKTLLTKCENQLDTNSTQQSIRECAEDLSTLGDTDWALPHVDHLLEECMETAAKEEEPEELPADAATPVGVSSSLLSELCLEECGEHGTCKNGYCDCEEGWTGDRCEVSKTTKPEVYPAVEPCDKLSTACSEIKIDGLNFVQNPKLSCIFRYNDADKEVAPADLISRFQVVCPEPDTKSKGSNVRVTVSNDGQTESEQSYLRVVYKSSCQTCTISEDGKTSDCVTMDDACTIDGECYVRDELHPTAECYKCDPDTSKTVWTRDNSLNPMCADETCPAAIAIDFEDSENDQLRLAVIVLGVGCGCLLLATLVLLAKYCSVRKSKGAKLLEEDDKAPAFDIHRTRVTDPTRDIPQATFNPVYDGKITDVYFSGP